VDVEPDAWQAIGEPNVALANCGKLQDLGVWKLLVWMSFCWTGGSIRQEGSSMNHIWEDEVTTKWNWRDLGTSWYEWQRFSINVAQDPS
jgi:hypothetical protein